MASTSLRMKSQHLTTFCKDIGQAIIVTRVLILGLCINLLGLLLASQSGLTFESLHLLPVSPPPTSWLLGVF